MVSSFAEDLPKHAGMGAEYARETAKAKAIEVAKSLSERGDVHEKMLVMGADTVVELGEKILEKPQDASHAKAMLSMLSGMRHEVHTGVAIVYLPPSTRYIDCSRIHTFSETTEVQFAEISRSDIDEYVASGEAYGKAGAYAIQGMAAMFVASVRGCYSNVVGLPIHRLCRELANLERSYFFQE